MQNQLLAAALLYAARGWPIFPCNSAKEPMIPGGVTEATTDAAKITEWWRRWPRAGIGLDVGGAGMMVVDIDAYKPGHDPAALAALALPDTKLRQRSPRGGEHLFYELSPGEVVSASTSKLAPGVDVRSFHSYVLLAPSATADGSYTWESEGKPSFRTDEMVRLANSHREKHADRDQWLIAPDLDENVAAAVEWLKKDAKVAVEGQGGEAMAYATAAHMKSFGISEALAFDLMWQYWNPRCVPPWDADQVDHLSKKVENGYEYNTSPPGNITAAYKLAKSAALFKPVARVLPSGNEYLAGRFRFVDRDGMSHIKPASWLIDDFLPRDAHTMLLGARGTFKTFIALDIALTVCTGFCVNPLWTANRTGPVLYIAGEGRSQMAQRVAAWEAVHWAGEKAPGFILGDPVPNVGEDWEKFIEGALTMSPKGYELVVIDTVGRSMQGLNENAQEHASKYTMQVDRLKRELGCTVLGLAHTGHENGGRARGSSVFEADADTIVRLDRSGKDYLVSLTMTKQKDAAEWEHPRGVKLAEVKLDMKTTSLVATVPAPAEKPKPTPKVVEEKQDEIVGELLDEAVRSVLADNTVKAFNTRDLAQSVAMRDEIEISSRVLENTTLLVLRETRGTYASKAYDPRTRRWKHVA